MEERLGFIRDKFEIKILILFVLGRLPVPVHYDTLAELTLCDDAISFFEYSECLADLVKTGHVTEKDNTYEITDLGRSNGKITESNLPYSVRVKAEKATAAISSTLVRDSLIDTTHYLGRRGGCTVELKMSDGVGTLIDMKILAASEQQAVRIEENFRANAEKLYMDMISLLDTGGEI